MKSKRIAVVVLVFVAAGLYWNLRPGGRWNQHEWISDHVKHPSAQQIARDKADYAQCKAKPDEFCIDWSKTSSFTPLRINLSQALSDCWDIDFCIRHSEAKVTPCP